MSMGTLNLLQGLLTPDLLRQAAKATGESEGGIAKALGAAFPVILGGLAQGAGNSTLMGNVAEMIKSPAVGALLGPGGGILGSIGSLLGAGAASGPVASIGSTLLSALFGNNIGGLIGTIGSLAGLRNTNVVGTLLSIAGPMVLSALGSRLGKSITGTGLSALLGAERNSYMGAVPAPLSGILSAMTAPGGSLVSTIAAAAPAAAAAAVAGAGAMASNAVSGAAGAVADATRGAASAAGQAASTATQAAATAASQAATGATQATASAARTAAAAATSAAGAATEYVEEKRGSALGGSILGLLLTGAIIAGLVFLLSQCNKVAAPPPAPKAAAPAPAPAPAPKAAEKKEAPPAPAPKAEAPPPPPAPAPAPKAEAPPPAPKTATSILASLAEGAGGLMKLALPTGKSIEIAKGGVEEQMIRFIEDASKPIDKGTWFDFDRLSFKTASSDLTPESKSQVEAVAEILKHFQTAKVKIGGYTDNQGDPAMNLKLSDDRAKRVMSELVTLGIGADRLEAEGYGEQHAIADNATPEGRAKNRRTALSVRAR